MRAYPHPEGLALFYRDVTERREREDALREAEARLRALADNLPGGMVYQLAMDRDGSNRRFLYVSRGFERMTGVPAEAALRRSGRGLRPDPARVPRQFGGGRATSPSAI